MTREYSRQTALVALSGVCRRLRQICCQFAWRDFEVVASNVVDQEDLDTDYLDLDLYPAHMRKRLVIAHDKYLGNTLRMRLRTLREVPEYADFVQYAFVIYLLYLILTLYRTLSVLFGNKHTLQNQSELALIMNHLPNLNTVQLDTLFRDEPAYVTELAVTFVYNIYPSVLHVILPHPYLFLFSSFPATLMFTYTTDLWEGGSFDKDRAAHLFRMIDVFFPHLAYLQTLPDQPWRHDIFPRTCQFPDFFYSLMTSKQFSPNASTVY